jgi:two-component system alkaline phosphatase synthesis response regulator PhoP
MYSLENEFECRCFYEATSFFDALDNDTPDLILLDIMLPGEDGYAILSRLKSVNTTSRIPVIMVSAKGEEVLKVKGLNMGADDYISKPFGVMELIARIKANLRKSIPMEPTKESENVVYKDVVIDLKKHSVTVNGKPIQTTLKEYNLLILLCQNPEKAYGREDIFRVVWGDDYIGETRTLDVHIKWLRKKLSDAGSKAVIETIRGVGYILT